ncbi:hypothetical protein ACTXT7_015231 [Hymenolepis weldensis]
MSSFSSSRAQFSSNPETKSIFYIIQQYRHTSQTKKLFIQSMETPSRVKVSTNRFSPRINFNVGCYVSPCQT